MDAFVLELMQENIRKNVDGKQVSVDAGVLGFCLLEIALQLRRQNELLEKKQ